ncbi:hypothetical protein MKY34_03015 [Sporosarcina sp. FSL K6-1522]|uniref:hypothetical protein n=1 Tax=Sporosarcina sp. FSL K6-1522 TaxID=2921554 RepID=UPI00315A74B5
MKLKKLTGKQRLAIIAPLTFVMMAFLVGAQSYFNNKEIGFASTECLEQGGSITVETSFLALEYSFSCDN